jgi:glycosyl-4,4'-diaponeurosporenoate acyltransferase
MLPLALFKPERWLHKPRAWERGGRFYEKVLFIKRWKNRLPDGAALYKQGFRKATLQTRTSAYLDRFYGETCRAETAHWCMCCCGPLFFLWNPPWAGVFMIFFGLVTNLPCILAQRYNRLRLARMLGRRTTTSS